MAKKNILQKTGYIFLPFHTFFGLDEISVGNTENIDIADYIYVTAWENLHNKTSVDTFVRCREAGRRVVWVSEVPGEPRAQGRGAGGQGDNPPGIKVFKQNKLNVNKYKALLLAFDGRYTYWTSKSTN